MSDSTKPMDNSQDNQNAEELSQLLDSALQDFNKKKTSDEELDDLMADMDREAAQKAAQEFNHMLQQMIQVFLSCQMTNSFRSKNSWKRIVHPKAVN